MKKLIVMMVVCPALALAQAGQGDPRGPGPGAGPLHGRPPAERPERPERMERMEQRARLARTLGLAEVLDLDDAGALKLRDALRKLDDRRLAAHRQKAEAREALMEAAQGEKAQAAAVDGAIAKLLDANAQLAAIEKELVQTVTKDLSPEKRARAVMFLERFERRMGPGGPGAGPGREGRMPPPGMHRRGPGGMGPGPMGMGPGPGPGGRCPNPDCPWQDEDDGA